MSGDKQIKKSRSVLKYGFFIVPVALSLYLLGITNGLNGEIADAESGIKTLEGELGDVEKEIKMLSESFDEEQYQTEVIEGKNSAEKIAGEVIDIQNKLAAFYKSSDPLPYGDSEEIEKERQAILKELELNGKKNYALTGTPEGDVDTWKLNPEWTLKLETTVMYGDVKRFPIIFSMMTKEGIPAGIVEAEYHVEGYKLTDIVKHYTNEGLRDEADIGGR